MSNIDKRAVQAVADLKAGYTLGQADVEIIQQMALDAVTLLDELEAAQKLIAELGVLAFNHALLDVISERQRQRSIEGWTSEHDDAYQNSELADAAACYAINAHNQGFSTPEHWPWAPEWWKQSGPRRDLVKAGALILAEIERIDRAAGKGE
ncbi:ead/Ea22-like family protein [Enterobacter asburiae]|uniref:ead/Ea22-like family protein n=1 Tax=Enterobacter asburiae TaxID=61645 RepID=UPI00079B8122|nr:ead/Ea22-like family protein [Enterobacter asburiae]CZY46179.1 Phage EaD protein [Enterobacter cloacae]MCK1017615.1 ead/Ea22-like family protein [Enterobacter asburiae]MDU2342937.1 ead/Ea22-like family protein [Enterobacter asburiae]MDU7759566.1 ead/Ea22-like family protein [Enterobacter asburiae]MEC5860667.1 ead/Ea22-like family protein [Enterobacter asburiae]